MRRRPRAAMDDLVFREPGENREENVKILVRP